MRKITIIGWSSKARAVVERVTFWPDEMKENICVAKSVEMLHLMTIEDVLVETEGEVMLKDGVDLGSQPV